MKKNEKIILKAFHDMETVSGLAESHNNSIAGKSLNDVPAITLFEAIYGKVILEKLNISLIPAQEVILTLELLK